jgi:hypothetical protein
MSYNLAKQSLEQRTNKISTGSKYTGLLGQPSTAPIDFSFQSKLKTTTDNLLTSLNNTQRSQIPNVKRD